MKRVATKIILFVMIIVTIIFSSNNVLAQSEHNEIISNDTKSQLVNITNKEKKSIEDTLEKKKLMKIKPQQLKVKLMIIHSKIKNLMKSYKIQ